MSSGPTPRVATVLAAFACLALGAAAAEAQPTFTKIFTPSTIGPGSVSTITFTITNAGGTPVEDLAFTDPLPAGVTIADPANASTTCDLDTSGSLDAPDGGSTITLTGAQVGGTASCTVTLDVTSSTPGMHTNPAITLSSSAGSSMSSAIDLTVDDQRPGFLKSFSPSPVSLGGRSTLTFTFDNSASADPVVFLSFVDTFPDGLVVADPTNYSTNCGQLSFDFAIAPGAGTVSLVALGALSPGFEVVTAGGTCTITFDVVGTTASALDNVTSNLESRSGNAFPPVSSGKASATLDVTAAALTLTKTFVDDPVVPGAEATLELTIFNFNRSFSASGVGFIDDLGAALAGLTFTSIESNDCGGMVLGVGTTMLQLIGGDVATEGFCTLRVKLAVPPGATPGSYVNTTGAVSGTVDGSMVTGNIASDTLFVEPVPLLTKEFTNDPVNAGDTVVLEFTVSNTSTTSSATDIAFTDFFPEVMATASATPGNGCCGAGSTCTFFPLNNPPPPASVTPARLVISGGTLAPAGMAGDSCTFSIILDLGIGTPPGFYVNTTTEITATVDGATRAGDPATDTLTVIGAPALAKSFTDDPVAPGDTVTLEFTLSHPADAPGAATGITFTDDLATVVTDLVANLPPSPDPPCGAGSSLVGSAGNTLLTLMNGSLLPGELCTFSVTLDVPADAAAGTHTNTTSGVSAMVAGAAATSAPATDDLRVTGLDFMKEFIGDPVVPGEMVTLRFTLENIDPVNDASSITFSDDLSQVLPGTPDLSVVTALPIAACDGNLSLIGSTFLTFSGGSLLQSDPPCSFDVVLQVPAGIADGTFINVTSNLQAVIDGSAVILDPANDSLVVDSDFLVLTKEFTDDPVAPGDSVNLRFTLTNLDGVQSASAISFTDNLGAALPGLTAAGLPVAGCGGTLDVNPDGSNVLFSGGSLGPAAQCQFDVSVDVPAGANAGDYLNTTSGVTGLINGLAVNGAAAMANLSVLNLIDFSKSFDGPTVAGGTAVLTFTLTNPGAATSSGLAFNDDLNAVISGLIATNLPLSDVCGSGSMLDGPSFLTLTGASLPPSGGTCTFDVELLVPTTADPGDFLNTTSELSESGLAVSDPATALLTIEPPPEFTKSFTPNAVGLGFTSVLTLTIDNGDSSLAASDLDFTDNLPAGLLVAMPPNASTTCTGGTLTAVAGSSTITYTNGGSVGAGASCTVQVDVVTTATGFLTNTTGELTSSSGNSGTAQATLAVDPPPGFAKSFSPSKIAGGGTSTLTFTIQNGSATVAATGLDFTDNLPADVVIATPGNASTTCTGGTLTATDGTGVVTYTGGSVAAFSSCTVQVDVTSSVVGSHMNVSGALTSSLGTSGMAQATLRVNPPPGFSKSFAPDPSIIGGIVTLTFVIDNTESTASATGLDFLDTLPAALLVADLSNATTDCSGGTLTATPGTATISYSGGTVGASSICTLSVDVTSTAAGVHTNTSGELTSSLGSSGTAEAMLTVNPPPVFAKAFVPASILVGDVATLVLSINNTASTADATDLDFLDNLPAEIVIADPSNATTDCGGGILTAVEGTGVVSYTGGIVPAMESCEISVDVTSDTLGMHTNTTSELTSSLGTSDPAEAVLTVEDLEGPMVASVNTAAGALAQCDTVRLPISTLGVAITDDRTPILGAGAAGNYLLVGAGPDGDFSTTDCASGVAGDDVAILVSNVALDDTDPLAVIADLTVGGANGLAAGLYRFFVCDTITDTAGNGLDGGDFEIPFFRADPLNLFENGNFDDCPVTLDPWTVTEVLPNLVQTGLPGTDDFAGSPLSASARIVQSTNDATSLAQCGPVEADTVVDFECWARYESMGALAILVKTCEFFDAADCAGTSLGEASVASLLEGGTGTWSFSETLIRVPAGAASAQCTVEAGPLGTDPLFDLSLDGLFFGSGDLGEIFSDGFESGDTSAWSSINP